MQISENTIQLLKNFASINAGILIRAGTKELKTKAVAGNIVASAVITEDFPVDVAIYDLNEFLNVMSLFRDPEMDFQEKQVVITDKKNDRIKVSYRYSALELITYSDKNVSVDDFDVEFDIKQGSIERLIKAASTLVVEDISLSNTEHQNTITMKVLDNKNSSSNVFAIDVGEYRADSIFDFHVKAENLKMMPGDYKLSLTSKGISRFLDNDKGLEYYIALEASSSFTE